MARFPNMDPPGRVAPTATSRQGLLRAFTVAVTVAALTQIAGASESSDPKPPFPMAVPAAPLFPAKTFDIREHGAVAGGETLNTNAIAAAITACSKAGGGRVLVPAGVWLTGPVHLRSKVELHVAEGAELRFSRHFSDYLPVVYMQRGGVRCFNYSPLIYARDCTDVAVTGSGTLNGQGDTWWGWKDKQPGMKRLFDAGAKGLPVEQRIFGSEQDGVRPPFIQTIDCRNVLLEDFTLRDGPSWNIHPVTCENVIVRKVSIIAKGPNNDGIDPDSCKNVLIEDCLLDTGDDCICLKAGRDQDGWSVGRPCENILIRRCRTQRGHGGVVLGSEMSAGIRNVFVYDCEFDGTDRGVRIKSLPGRGGFIENVWFQDIRMGKIRNQAIEITLRYGDRSVIDPATKAQPALRGIHFDKITCRQANTAIEIHGLPENLIRDLSFENVTLTAGLGAVCSWVGGMRLTGTDIRPDKGPVLRLTNSTDVVVSDAICPVTAQTFLRVEGAESRSITLGSLRLNAKQRVAEFTDGAPADSVSRKER